MMVALEEQQRTRQEVDTARQYLSSTDDAEIDGFEDDLLSTGRYVGQPELVLLIEDWAAVCPGATCEVSSDGEHMTLRGTLEMEQHLRAVQARGERSAAELDELARKLRDEQAVTLSLDQETARTMGEQLLSATHPLTRAALGVPGHTQARYAHVSIDASDVPPGRYLSLISVARWTGLRQSSELWTAAVDLESSQVATESVGLRILANLAEAKLAEGTPSDAAPGSLDNLRRIMLTRQATEEDRRRAENDALVETRRISLRETHARKVRQIQRRIDTLVATGKSGPVRLFEAQLRNQDRLLDQRERELEGARVGALSVEHLAVCTIEVRVA
jgi:hypothetical protein